MGNLLRTCATIFLTALILCAACNLYCDGNDSNQKTFRGTVTEIDWVGSLITVDGGDEITFYVPPGTNITRGVERIGLSSIEQNDMLVIRYYNDSSGRSIAVNINDENAYPEF